VIVSEGVWRAMVEVAVEALVETALCVELCMRRGV
jgi:hypothetical protein